MVSRAVICAQTQAWEPCTACFTRQTVLRRDSGCSLQPFLRERVLQGAASPAGKRVVEFWARELIGYFFQL